MATGRVFGSNSFGSVYISELLVEDSHPEKSKAGETSGWIELYNAASFPVNLSGWFLTDDPANLMKWRFPELSILPGTYLVVSTSGTGRTNDPARVQTNFRLRQEGGYLALVGSGTNVVSDFGVGYPKQSPGVSYGRMLGEPQVSGYLPSPTPGKPNQSSGSGFAPSVQFSRGGGLFQAPFSLELSCASTNAVIRFTLDRSAAHTQVSTLRGTTGRHQHQLYSGARVRRQPASGPPHSESYQLLATNLPVFGSRLPVIVMNSFGSERSTSARSSFVQRPIMSRTRES